MTMKNKTFFILLSFIFLSLGSFGKQHEVKKQIEKNFKVNENAHLQIENKYGAINIVEGTNKEIVFSIEITGKGETEKSAQEMADRANVDFNQNGNNVSATTVLSSYKNFHCNNCGTTINYTVTVPSSVYMYLINKYGDVSLNIAYQNFKAEVKYGNLRANQLKGQKNEIWIKYGSIELGETAKLELDIAYAKMYFTTIGNLELTTAYSTLNAEAIDQLSLNSKYDKFYITTLGSADISTAYSDFNIDLLKKKFDVSTIRYGKIRIDEISPDFESIFISAAYTPIRLGLTEKHSFYTKLSVRYGNIQAGNLKFHDVTLPEKNEHYTQTIEGVVGSKTHPKAQVEISDSYANIVLK